MKAKVLILLYLITSGTLWAQTQIKTDSICFNKKVIDYSIDATGSIFLSFEGGEITKYTANLDSLFTYSPTKVGNTKLLEAGNGLIIFAFYDFFQEYVLTDRFLSRPTRTKLSNSSIDYIDLATQSQDNNIWLVENSGFRLVKFNVALNRIEFETALNTVIDSPYNNFTFIKEYQNQVFLIDENSGIYVFDNLGNFSKFIPATTNKCMFEKNEIFYLENNEIIKVDIYSDQKNIEDVLYINIIGIMKYANNTYFIAPTCLYRTH